jgi:hypothetical protein
MDPGEFRLPGGVIMNLKSKALLVHLGLSSWSPNKIDKDESRALRKKHNTAPNFAKVSKKLLDSPNLKDILTIKGMARNEHYRQTLPWKDGDLRILPTANFLPYQALMNGHKAKFDAAITKFLADYDQDITAAPARLGSLYNSGDYPSANALKKRFSFSVQFYAISEETDFRVDLAETEIKAIQQESEKLIRESIKESVNESWNRIGDAVKRAETALSDPENNRFHATMIKNLEDLAEVLPRLNIAGDPSIDAMAAEIKARLTKYTTATLKTDKGARKETAAAATDILAKVETERQKIETLDALGAYSNKAPQ